jgi:hypothetical protein
MVDFEKMSGNPQPEPLEDHGKQEFMGADGKSPRRRDPLTRTIESQWQSKIERRKVK